MLLFHIALSVSNNLQSIRIIELFHNVDRNSLESLDNDLTEMKVKDSFLARAHSGVGNSNTLLTFLGYNMSLTFSKVNHLGRSELQICNKQRQDCPIARKRPLLT